MKNLISVFLLLLFSILTTHAQKDPYLWLEEVDSPKSLEFVNTQNKITVDKLTHLKEYNAIYAQCLEVYNDTDKIEYPRIYGSFIYNFWQDKDHVRGIWRRSPKANYLDGSPIWETLLDLDEMSKNDDIKWVFKGARGSYPNYNRFIIKLSKGGGDAAVRKEFNAVTKKFDKNGFYIDESKGSVSYLDENTLIVSCDFGENTMTSSGYPNQVKLWRRGTPLKEAQLIYEGDPKDVRSWGDAMRDGLKNYILVQRAITFYTSQYYVWLNDQLIKLDIPENAIRRGILNNQLIVDLKSDWIVDGETYEQGSIVSLNFTDLLEGKKTVTLVLQPDTISSVSTVAVTKNKLLINMLKNVNGELYTYAFVDGKWQSHKVNAPPYGTISIISVDKFSDQYFFQFQNFLTPSTLFVADANKGTFQPLKSLKAYFDDSKYEVHQFFVQSKDGTRVPYFMVSAKNMKYDSSNPTLLSAYGGFEISSKPFYSGTIGTAWLDHGGVFIRANIRGGGEYGPRWHQAGLKEKRQNVYDDFHAVAEDLIARKITSPKHLGIMGGSNGGLLVGVAFTQKPNLYNAVICQVPLLDMQRYNKLLAGASWMGEYGNPDIPEEWAYIKKYSPYHNLKKEIEYPEVFFTTSTRDDRVHPGHARKMAAKMMDMGHPIYYYENTEGGHSGSSTNEQRAKRRAMTFSYLLMKLAH